MKVYTNVLVMLIIFSTLAFSQDNKNWKVSDIKENGNSYVFNTASTPIPFVPSLVDPIGTIPVLTGFYDYVTNGNNLRNTIVLGDTVIAATVWTDSANAQVSTARTVRYSVSYDGGFSWTTDVLIVSQDGNAYPDMSPVMKNGRTVAIAGRQFATGGVRKGYVGLDLLLGLGIFSNTLSPPPGYDLFAYKLSNSKLAGVYLSNAGTSTPDSVCYVSFDYITETYSNKLVLNGAPNFDINTRQYVAASGQNVFVAWWVSTADAVKMVGKESTDGGATFGSAFTILPYPYVFPNGDSVSAWFGADVLYKPNSTTKMMAYNTLAPGNFGTRRGSKLLFWSPGINGGNPVVIADWTKPNIPLLNDSLTYENKRWNIQVGMTAVSHPSLAYTDDGSRLICAFSVSQPDTIYQYNYNDIYVCYSSDDGATWSNPRNLTNTADVDEIYVSLAKTGNLPGNAGMTFSVSGCPGSTSFTNTATPICTVYQVYRRYDPVTGNLIPIGVKSISNEIPEKFALGQNYPNPFNPSTTIEFSVPRTSDVNLDVFDVTGRLVASLVKGEKLTPGVKSVNFNASNLASGIYFYTLKAGDFRETKKMILVK